MEPSSRIAFGLVLAGSLLAASAQSAVGSEPTAVQTALAHLSHGFDENVGQWPRDVRFQGRAGTLGVQFAVDGFQLALARPIEAATDPRSRPSTQQTVAVRFSFVGSSSQVRLSGADRLPVRVNYFVGPEEQWRRDVPRYARVAYKGLFTGIDASFYQEDEDLKYDFIVAAGADPSKIILTVQGAQDLRLSDEGDLLIVTALGTIRQRKPIAYQGSGDSGTAVVAGFSILAGGRVVFNLGPYDSRRELVIDPEVTYSTYLGGNGHEDSAFHGLTVDGEGNVYLTGMTDSTSGLLATGGGMDVFIAKIDPDLPLPVWVTYVGGPDLDYAWDIKLDAMGNTYVVGTEYPFPPTGFISKIGPDGAATVKPLPLPGATAVAVDSSQNAYVVGLSTLLTLDQNLNAVQSFSLPGPGNAYDVAIDPAGNVYVAGAVSDFPQGDQAYVVKLGVNPYQTVLSPRSTTSAYGLAVDTGGHAYVVASVVNGGGGDPHSPGADVYVARLDPAGALEWGRFLGGSNWDIAFNIITDGEDGVYVVGQTASPDFPTKDPFTTPLSPFAAFVTKLSATAGETIWSTVIAGNGGTAAWGVALDPSLNVWVEGPTGSTSGLVGPGGVQPQYGGGGDVFLLGIKQKEAGLEVLPSTTRWRPQKDTVTPVVVTFTAPKGYTPSRLEIMDPNGALLSSQNIDIASPTGLNADPGQYAITWNGPWTWTDSSTGQLHYQAAGNYTFKVYGSKADGTPLDSDASHPCSGAAAGMPACSVISLVEVTAIAMADKPNTRGRVRSSDLGSLAGGWAIFPEARNPSPGDQVNDEDKIEIIATVTPDVPDPRTQGPVTIYFRGIDVDDPSANKAPIDDENLPSDNCLGGGCVIGPAGNLNGQNADTTLPVVLASGQTEAVVDFQVSGRQGDNYRVAASTSSTWLSPGLSAKQNSSKGEVVHASGETVIEPDGSKGEQVSEMLTVWRTLHLEVDHLDSGVVAQTAAESGTVVLDSTGTITKLDPQTLTDDNAIFVVTPPKGMKRPVDHSKNDDWAAADLWPHYDPANLASVVKVTGNRATSLEVDKSADLMSLAIPGDPYRLSDDRRVDLTGDLPLTLTRDLLRRAYIDTKIEAPDLNTSMVQTFERNLESIDLAARAKNVPSSDRYWAVLIIDGFDASVIADNDPDKESGTLGETLGAIPPGGTLTQQDPFQPICAVFRETIRDSSMEKGWQNAVLERTTAHEILCHALNWDHEPATLCHPAHLEGFTGAEISDDHLAALRRLLRPKYE